MFLKNQKKGEEEHVIKMDMRPRRPANKGAHERVPSNPWLVVYARTVTVTSLTRSSLVTIAKLRTFPNSCTHLQQNRRSLSPNVEDEPAEQSVAEDMSHRTNYTMLPLTLARLACRHPNSIDKNADGDYLLSARYTNAVYKISGVDGTILWTLGGIASNFDLDGFNFSRQHDARFLDQTDTSETITLFDNGGDWTTSTAAYSSALIITLDMISMKAHVVRRWIRPGHRQSLLRGNFQLLPNGNAFCGWSDNCHISEHAGDGEQDLLMEAEFRSERFVTYRAYKFNFTGAPSASPALKAFVYGTEPELSTSVFYVSWNGATEVATWQFYRVSDGKESLIGTKERTGFETRLLTFGYETQVFAQAMSRQGTVLGRSDVEIPLIPTEWALHGGGGEEHAEPTPNESVERGHSEL